MMKVKVISPFHDINDFSVIHREGESLEVSDLRGDRLVRLGYAVVEQDMAPESPAYAPVQPTGDATAADIPEVAPAMDEAASGQPDAAEKSQTLFPADEAPQSKAKKTGKGKVKSGAVE